MEVSPRYKELTLFTLLTLFSLLILSYQLLYTAQTVANMPSSPYNIVREDWNAIGMG